MADGRLELVQVDAFTRRAYGGNPCAVVFDADELDATQMQVIAREMNLSETAFVLASARADFRARYFTPAEEIPLAGHPTIATIHALLRHGRIPTTGDDFTLTLELKAGVIEVAVTGARGELPLITMTQMTPGFLSEHRAKDVLPAFGLDPADALDGVPIMTVSTGTPQLMIALKSLDALRRATLVVERYRALRSAGDFFSPHLFVNRGIDDRGATFARHFSPPPDVLEDPFTGSATGGMGAYLWRHGLLDSPRFIAQQGHWMGRPGEAMVEIDGTPENITAVRVGGHAVEVMSGRLEVPPKSRPGQRGGA